MTRHAFPKGATLLIAASLTFSASPLIAANKGVETGLYPAGELFASPETHAPATVSRTLVQTVTPLAGEARVEIPSQGGRGLLVWAIPASAAARRQMRNGQVASAPVTIGAALRTPSGRVFASEDEGSIEKGIRRFSFSSEEVELDLPESQQVIHVSDAEAGLYRLDIKTAGDTGAVTIVAAEPESRLTLTTWAGPLSRQPGQPITLHAELFEGDAPLAGARVSARLAPQGGRAAEAIDLYDDGRHGDGEAGDGVYAATLSDLQGAQAGFVAVRFEAEGRDARGFPFARTGSGGFMNERGAARLLDGSVATRFVGEGADRKLRVEARSIVRVAGDYRFDVIVAGPASADGSRKAIAWGQTTDSLAAGSGTLAIEIPLPAAPDGALHLDVRLLGLDPVGVAGRVEVDTQP